MNPIEQHRPDEWALYQPLRGTRMLELGGKWCSQASATYKSVFEALGFEHISVDWNGQHGALRLDLREPQWEDLGEFDMVTNFGTTEHVDDQSGVWANIHYCTAQGGYYVGQTPYADGRNWWWHGQHYVTEKFYEDFAAMNGWKIERLYVGREEPYRNLYCRMQKLESAAFHMPQGGIKINQRRSRHSVPATCKAPAP